MTTTGGKDFVLAQGSDTRKDPVRLVVIQGDERPAVDALEEPVVMTFPHLVIRELIALLSISIVLVIVSLFFNAPLEELANPEKTPNPAKAPWYFLGLQELLHYYPPLVSGVVLPGLVVLALMVIPYFDINLVRPPLLGDRPGRTTAILWTVVAALTAVFLFSGAHPVWPLIVPLWLVAALSSMPAFAGTVPFVRDRIAPRSLAFWIFLYFLLAATTLTAIGVFFRGPGWSFVPPWSDAP